MFYIGITGHRGAGKTAIAYLLGNTLECLKRNNTFEDIQVVFNEKCSIIRANNNAIYDCPLYYVYFDEFSEQAKYFISQILGIDMSLLDSDSMKDNMYVNLKDFTIHSNKADVAVNIETYISSIPTKSDKPKRLANDVFMSLRNFIEMFSVDMMQKYLGGDVWIKMLNISKLKYGEIDEGWRIFSDVKLVDELNYIKKNNGIIIKVIRPSNRKASTRLSNTDFEADYLLETEGNLEGLFEPIYNIAKDIYEKSR